MVALAMSNLRAMAQWEGFAWPS